MKQLRILLLLLTLNQLSFAQTNNFELPTSINEDGSAPDASSILDIQSTDKGVLFPRLTLSEILAINSPTEGLMVYDLDNKCLRIYNGEIWNCYGNDESQSSGIVYAFDLVPNNIYTFYINDMASDNKGNVFITGTFSGIVNFMGTVASANAEVVFAAKINNSGNLEWLKNSDGAGEAAGNGIDVDNDGNVYVTGWTDKTITYFDNLSIGHSNDSGPNIFLVKYNKDGEIQWVINPNVFGVAEEIATDENGNSYITGFFRTSTNFDGININTIGIYNVFVAKYNTSGNILWVKKGEINSYASGNGIDININGQLYVTGNYHKNAISFDAFTIPNKGVEDIFIAQFDENGTIQWLVNAGSNWFDLANSIVTDEQGNAYLTGSCSNNATFNSYNNNQIKTIQTNNNSDDIYVAKYNENGVIQWLESGGGIGSDVANSIAINKNGNEIVVSGSHSNQANFGGSILNIGSISDIITLKYDNDGNFIWQKNSGGTSSGEATSNTIDVLGNTVIGGIAFTPTYIGNTIINSISGTSIFLVKYND